MRQCSLNNEKIMKKLLFLKEKRKLNFCVLFYHLEKATKIVFLNFFRNFVIVLVAILK